MLATLMNAFFGCTHRNTTFPISLRGGKARNGQAGVQRGSWETYVVCLDCGKEFPYSWEEMRMLPAESGGAVATVPEQVGSFSTSK